MWAKVLNWLISTCEYFFLKRETFYLSLSLFDWFFSEVPKISRDQVQLIGLTSLFLAQKFEELNPKKLDQFVEKCDSAYVKQDVLEMERTIIN